MHASPDVSQDRDDSYHASLRAIREGWSDVQNGRTRSVAEFFRELDRKFGLPPENTTN